MRLIEPLDYSDMAGVIHLRHLREELQCAIARKDWMMVRRLNNACALVVNRVIAANNGDTGNLVAALSDLKEMYAYLIQHCQTEAEVTVMAG